MQEKKKERAYLSSLLELTCSPVPLKLLTHKGLGAREACSLGHGQGKVQIAKLLAHKGDHRGFVHAAQDDLTATVDGVEATSRLVSSGDKNRVRAGEDNNNKGQEVDLRV